LEYPTAFYFFVNRAKPELAKELAEGLKKLQKSGEFDMLFEQYFSEDLNKLQAYRAKHVIKLKNPFYSEY
jgi:ABC-type amino acid transport substrate-binding protein